ncbi:MAG: alpha-L-fucosidase [Gemmatimonadetes bacterium]|jgi:alpha-L-fucosidase|nr:alpha-L-fucosidase [Gemmatimonadota bacterium]
MIARLLRTPTCALAACLLPASALLSQPGYTPTPENVAARTWFQDARFGLFVHWGVYSQMGAGEWVMNNRSIRASDYERLPSSFNPTAYDATAWVALAKAAGMKYITITSKHHDGFAMFDSKVSDYTIVKRTPFARDPIRQLVDAAGKEGIKVFFYYSQLDWHHPDYFPLGSTGRQTGRPDGGNFDRYLDYMNGQLKELLTNYGPVGGIWFDGMWDKPEANWRLDETYRLIHQLQPAALIGSNHHVTPIAGEDFQMIEKDLPGQNSAGFNKAEMSTLPLETCETMNGSWGFDITDRNYKSSRDLIRYLVRSAGANANFLLNVGPMPNGTIQPEFVERLRAIGKWLEVNGESVYGTRGGPVSPRPWGVTTRKANKIYVHILDWMDDDLWLPLDAKVRRATVLGGEGIVRVQPGKGGVLLSGIAALTQDDIDTIVVLEIGQ